MNLERVGAVHLERGVFVHLERGGGDVGELDGGRTIQHTLLPEPANVIFKKAEFSVEQICLSSIHYSTFKWLFKDAQDKVMDFDQDDDEGKMLFLHRLDPSRSSLVRPGLSPE